MELYVQRPTPNLQPPVYSYEDEQAILFRNFGLDQQEQFIDRPALLDNHFNVPILLTDDDLLPTAVVSRFDQEEFLTFPSEKTDWNSLAFLDDEIIPAGKNFFLEQQEFWPVQGNNQTQNIVWNPVPFLDDEIGSTLKKFSLEQEEFWTAQYLPGFRQSVVYSEPEELPQLRYDQEEPYTTQVQRIEWRSISFLDDEIFPNAKNFGLDQQEFWTAQTQSVPWSAFVFNTEEIGSQLSAASINVDDDPQFIPQFMNLNWKPIPFADDEIISGGKNFFIDDERAYVPEFQSTKWPVQSLTDDDQLARVTYDQEDGQTFGPILHVWNAKVFSEDELKPTSILIVESEDNPTWKPFPPVWIIRPFADDEIGKFIVLPFTADQQDDWQPSRMSAVYFRQYTAPDDEQFSIAGVSTGCPDAILYWGYSSCPENPQVQSIEVAAGSGAKWEFRQFNPSTDLTGKSFEVRILFTVPVIWSTVGGKLSINSQQTIIADPIPADTISFDGSVRVELWETTVPPANRLLKSRFKFDPPIT